MYLKQSSNKERYQINESLLGFNSYNREDSPLCELSANWVIGFVDALSLLRFALLFFRSTFPLIIGIIFDRVIIGSLKLKA